VLPGYDRAAADAFAQALASAQSRANVTRMWPRGSA